MAPGPLRRAPGLPRRRLSVTLQACLAAVFLAAGHRASQALGAFAVGAWRQGPARSRVARRAQRAFSIALGSELSAKVTKVSPQGAYLDLGLDLPGFLHVSKLDSTEIIESAESVLTVGDDFKVWLARYDKRQVEVWKFPPVVTEGQQLTGKVTDVEKFGVFLDLGLDRKGFLPARQMRRPDDSHVFVKDKFSVGDEATVWVTAVKKSEVEVRSWETGYDIGFEGPGTVAKFTKSGAFIELPGEGKPGYLPCSQMAMERVESPGDKLQLGEEVIVKVIGLDRNKGIALALV